MRRVPFYAALMADEDDDVAQLVSAAHKVLRYPITRIDPHREGCGGMVALGDSCSCGMTDLRHAMTRFRVEGDEVTKQRRAERRARWWGN